MKIKVLGVLVLLAGLFGVVESSRAFSLSPTKYLLTLAPDSGGTVEITLENGEEQTRVFELSVLALEQDDAGHTVVKKDGSGLEIDWVRPEVTAVELSPGESRTIKFLVTVPREAAAGSYYLGLAAKAKNASGGDSALGGQLATLLYLKVAGLANESLNVTVWRAPKVVSKPAWYFSLTMENGGNMELPLTGSLTVRNWRGMEIISHPVDLGGVLIAGEKRVLGLAAESSRHQRFWPGRYTAEIKVVFGQTRQINTRLYNFWYLPVWFVVMSLILIGGAVVFAVKKIVNKKHAS